MLLCCLLPTYTTKHSVFWKSPTGIARRRTFQVLQFNSVFTGGFLLCVWHTPLLIILHRLNIDWLWQWSLQANTVVNSAYFKTFIQNDNTDTTQLFGSASPNSNTTFVVNKKSPQGTFNTLSNNYKNKWVFIEKLKMTFPSILFCLQHLLPLNATPWHSLVSAT